MRRRQIVGRSVIVHLIGILLGLCILLSPSRPYRGLEEQAFAHRHYWLPYRVSKAWNAYVEEHHALPPAHNYEELLELLRPRLVGYVNDSGVWAAAYVPRYYRFDTTEMRREPVEWNPQAMKLKLNDASGKMLWLMRRREDHYCTGLVLQAGYLRSTRHPEDLGFETAKDQDAQYPLPRK